MANYRRFRLVVGSLAVAAAVGAPASAQVPPARVDSALPGGAADSARFGLRGLLSRADSAITPRANQALGVDAEIRIALFELATDRVVPALSRLEWLRQSPTALGGAAAAQAALLKREDMLFLLSQAYYRMGMGEQFRQTAQQLAGGGGPGRYAALLRLQLMLDAYRRGDYAQAIELSRAVGSASGAAGDRALGALVAGLAAYHGGNYGAARESFAAAQQGGGNLAAYAQYMAALAQLEGDTTRATAALDALRPLATTALGEFADQVRLTAAQLAYEADQYDQAATFAAQVPATSGLGGQALLTRAWALYKANQLDAAAEAFRDFASRYPQLPERDEARLMAGQVLLQNGRAGEAAQLFQAVADSIGREVADLQGDRAAAMGEAARALVGARLAGLMYLNQPGVGKTISLPDAAGADMTVLSAAFGDSAVTSTLVSAAPDIVSLADVEARLTTLGPSLGGGFPRRVLYLNTAGGDRTAYLQRAQALNAADVAVAVARYRLAEQLEAHQLKIATIQRLQEYLAGEGGRFDAMASRLQMARDSIARVTAALDATAEQVRSFMRFQTAETRRLAGENAARIDSIRSRLGTLLTAGEGDLLTIESQTAATYRRVADAIERDIEGALRRNPVFALHDSVRARSESAQALLAQMRGLAESTNQLLAAELGRLQGAEPPGVRQARGILASVEAQRATAEGQLVAIVEAELRQRASQMVSLLRRDTEAAEFGAASASFFQSMEGRSGAASTNGGAGAAATAPAGTSTSTGGIATRPASAPNATPQTGTKPATPRQQ